jgi:HlyD family secretion protein
MFGRFVSWVRRHPVWSGIIALGVLLIGYQVLAPTPKTYAYVSEAASTGDVITTVSASGKLRALNTIKVGAEVSGQVTRVLVDYNSQVVAGQVLAEIDPTRIRARVQQAQAQVASAEAARAQAEAGLIRARTDLEVQEREYARAQSLVKEGFVSKSRLDAAQNLLATARASVRTASAQIASARAQISQSQAELSSANLELRRTVIVAPATGVVINKLVEPGTTVAANFQTPNLFEIAADTTRMQVEASVDEADIGQIREGQEVKFTVDAFPDERFPASVRQIRKAATETQNVVSYLVILDVDNQGGRLLPGMTANVEILTGRVNKVTRVPSTALRFRPRAQDRDENAAPDKEGSFVFVEGPDPYKPIQRAVKTGLIGESFAEIKSGIKPGEKLIVRSRSLAKKKPDEDAADDEEDDGSSAP